MSRFKQAAPGSPFQFRSLPEQLGPLLKDVREATLLYNPGYSGPGSGMMSNVVLNLRGRVHRRLCPKTIVNHVLHDRDEPAELRVVFALEGEADQPHSYRLDARYPTMRDLMLDLAHERGRLAMAAVWRRGNTVAESSIAATAAAAAAATAAAAAAGGRRGGGR